MIFVRLALAIILLVWVLKQNMVTPEIAFLTLSWYNITRLSLVMFVPNAFTFVAEALKSISRIEVRHDNKKYCRSGMPSCADSKVALFLK